MRFEKCGREIGDSLLGVGLLAVPATSIEPVQLDLLALHPHIAGEQVRMGHGHVQLRAVRIFDGEHLAARIADHNLRRTQEASNAIIEVNDQFARLDVHGLGKTLTGANRRRPRPAIRITSARARHTVTFGHHHQPFAGEAPAQRLILDDERALSFFRSQILAKRLPHAIHENGIRHPLFREPRQRRSHERTGRHLPRRRVPREHHPKFRRFRIVRQKPRHLARIVAIVQLENRALRRQEREESFQFRV